MNFYAEKVDDAQQGMQNRVHKIQFKNKEQ